MTWAEIDMRIIDTHVHVWTRDTTFPWAEDPAGLPRAEARPEVLLELMDADGVAGAVLVQYIGYRWDNRYVARALHRLSPALSGGVPGRSAEIPRRRIT